MTCHHHLFLYVEHFLFDWSEGAQKFTIDTILSQYSLFLPKLKPRSNEKKANHCSEVYLRRNKMTRIILIPEAGVRAHNFFPLLLNTFT